MEPEILLASSKEPGTEPYSEPDEFNLRPHILFTSI
jgi:hypothetical protein